MVRLPLGKEAICLILLPRYGYDGWVDEAFLEYLADGFHLPREKTTSTHRKELIPLSPTGQR